MSLQRLWLNCWDAEWFADKNEKIYKEIGFLFSSIMNLAGEGADTK